MGKSNFARSLATISVAIALASGMPQTIVNAAPIVTSTSTPQGTTVSTTENGVTTDQPGEQTIDGISFGVGFGGTFYPQKNVKTAGLQNGLVTVTDSDNKSVGLWLTTHYFWGFGPRGAAAVDSSGKAIIGSDGKPESAHLYGYGPFVAIQAASSGGSSNNVINSVGLGAMIGFRQSASSTNSLNFGIGYSLTNITVLGGGMTEGKSLPMGVTSVATQSKYVGAPFLLVSFTY